MLLIAGAFCLIYYLMICIFSRKWDATFSRFWLAAGILLPVFWFWDRVSGIPAVCKWAASILLLLLFLTLCRIVLGRVSAKKVEFDCLIVLGAQVRGTRITDSLARRLEKVYIYAEVHPKTKVIVSGGQGRGEDITEASAMAEYLLERGVEKERIILEDQSKTTEQNLKFSARFLDKENETIGIVSNNFHLYRACLLARRLGYGRVYPLSASCHPVLFVNYLIREAFAVWKLWICG